MKKRLLFGLVVLSLILPAQVQATESSTAKTFLKVEVANEKLNLSYLLIGRVTEGKLRLVTTEGERQFDWLPEPISVKSAEAGPEISANEFTRLSLTFDLFAEQVPTCERQREFRTFLGQLDLFRNHIREFYVTATSRKFADCAARMASQIVAKGYRAQVVFSEIAKGGISVRAYFHGTQTPQVSESEAQGSKGKSLERIIEIFGRRMRPRQVRLNADGYFIMSFADERRDVKVKLVSGDQILASVELPELPRFFLGEHRAQIFGYELMTLARGNFDAISVEVIPDMILQAAVEEFDRSRRAYSTSIDWSMGYFSFEGSGGMKPVSGLIPLNATFRHRLNQNFHLSAEGTAPLTFLGDAPSWTYLRSRLTYWLVGEEDQPGRPAETMRVGLSGEFYYLRNQPKVIDEESADLVLTDLLGVLAGINADYRIHPKWKLSARYEIGPFPEAPGYQASVSQLMNFEVENCWGPQNCWFMGWKNEKYEVSLVEIGKIDFSVSGPLLGYRRVLK